MNNNRSDNQEVRKTLLNLIGQAILAVLLFLVLGWLVQSVSFLGMNGPGPHATAGISSQEIFDTFGYKVFDGKWNESTWAEVGTGSQIQQLDGVLTLSRNVAGSGGLVAYQRKWGLSQIDFVESNLVLNRNTHPQDGNIGVAISATMSGTGWLVKCAIHGGPDNKPALILCDTADKFSTTPVEVSYDTWHVVRFEVDAEKTAVTFFVDGQKAGRYLPEDTSGFKIAEWSLMLGSWSSTGAVISGAFDYVQLKTK